MAAPGVTLSSNSRQNIALSELEEALLRRYLPSYQRLVAGELPANTAARRRFIEVANQQVPPVAIHEVAFVKWQMKVGLRPYEPLAPFGTTALPVSPPVAPRLTKTAADPRLAALAERRAETYAGSTTITTVGPVSPSPSNSRDATAQQKASFSWDRLADWFNASLGTDFARKLDGWMRDTFATAKPTIYDKAMDATHIAHPSGAFHRLWDEGHSLTDAWKAVATASPNDTFTEEIAGYLAAIWKDVITPMGLPFATVNRDWFNATHTSLHGIGISKAQLADALSYTGTELAGAALGAVAMLLCWDKAETERAANLAGSLGLSTLCAANPVLGIVAIACFARAVQTAKAAKGRTRFVVGLMKGGLGSGALIATSAVIGGPVWIGLVAGLIASILVHHAVVKGAHQVEAVDWSRVRDWAVEMFRGMGSAKILVIKAT